MSLQVLASDNPEILTPELIGLLRAACADGRPAVLLVPSFSQALDASRSLAAYPELSLGIACTTPAAWVRERWEVWGDGRALADQQIRLALSYHLAVQGAQEAQDGLSHTPGMALSLSRLAREALAWLPAHAVAGLSGREQEVVDLALRYGAVLHERGFAEPCEAMAALPRIFAARGVSMPEIVVAGFSDASFAVIGFLADLAVLCPVCVSVCEDGRPQTESARGLVASLIHAARARGIAVEELRAARSSSPAASDELALLGQALFRAGEAGVVRPVATGAVRLAHATGPFAEPELVVREVERLVEEGARSIVICAPNAGDAWDGLSARLAARGLFVQGTDERPACLAGACRAFLSLASGVCDLAEADRQWESGDGHGLPPMSWWPPRPIVDFLLSSISGVSEEAAWNLDKRLRGNRALSPREVLMLLQREGTTSHACAQAVRLIIEGRIGSAAHLLARNLIETGADPASDDVRALELIAQLQASVARLGMTAAGAKGRAIPELVELLAFMCGEIPLGRSLCIGTGEEPVTVRICSRAEAARLAPASSDALVFTHLTSAEWPLKQRDDALANLLAKLGLAVPADPLARARHRFARSLAAARHSVILEMSLHDRDARSTYPAVVLAELLASYADDAVPPVIVGTEDQPAAKLSASGAPLLQTAVLELPGEDCIQDRSMLVLPHSGSGEPRGLLLSATQIETYLDCPLKWYAQNRIRVDGIDADFTNMQKGSFAHVVLERTHGELLYRAAVAQGLLAEGEPIDNLEAACIAGARISASNLDEAARILDAVFDEHLALQREKALRKESHSLVPHTASEQYQVELLRRDLHATLAFEQERFAGFEPRYFELRFGCGEGMRTARYAGAGFVGTIDRIDVNGRGEALVIDYKHKSALSIVSDYNVFPKKGPGEGFALDGFVLPRHIQTLAYAQIIRRIYPKLNVVGALYLSTQGAVPDKHALAGLATEETLVRVMGEDAAREWGNAMCPPRGTDFHGLLDATEELVAAAVERLASARIEADPRDAESCRFCPVLRCDRRLG
ncbi:PD-(D/E)XK nuclease family protein [Coriobacteriales bacterium OH1046]|nr:PD-(D/E)XK nuclease family protein [Coriobacteriales bacterium OH1046]